jgi:hypothetical protein
VIPFPSDAVNQKVFVDRGPQIYAPLICLPILVLSTTAKPHALCRGRLIILCLVGRSQ